MKNSFPVWFDKKGRLVIDSKKLLLGINYRVLTPSKDWTAKAINVSVRRDRKIHVIED